MEYGRLVDVYAYRMVDPQGRKDRRDTLNRKPVLIEEDVVIGAGIIEEELFNASGEVRDDARFRFLPFDVNTGHPRLLVLFDDRDPIEGRRFEDALSFATGNLTPLADAYRGQNTNQNPVPVLPRNAALVLNFDNEVGVDEAFFDIHPGAVQLLVFRADPSTAGGGALTALPKRVIPKGRRLIVDTTIIGGESRGTVSNGLPPSVDNVTANIRLALPSRGVESTDFWVERDEVASLNGIGSRGRDAVIRDFRSGNDADGRLSSLSDREPPMIVADHEMGINAIDRDQRVLTINKRFRQVVIRGRIPFVDGPLRSNGLPTGPNGAPGKPLRSGDIVTQRLVDPSTGESFILTAEILENLELQSDASAGDVGLARDGSDGSTLTQVRVRVATLSATDENGREWSFTADSRPLGSDCTVRSHYYHELDVSGVSTGDSQRIEEFLVFEPSPPKLINGQPVQVGTKIDPFASVALRFSEPMDLESVNTRKNYFVSNPTMPGSSVDELIESPKVASLSIVPTRQFDVQRDGTLLRLTHPHGHFHVKGAPEKYWLHLMVDEDGVTDLAGNQVNLFDDPVAPAPNFSVEYELDADADTNRVGWRVYRFEDPDEDGTPPGSVDLFGQFLLRDGKLRAAETVRFSRTADAQNLGGITRWDRGECYDWDPSATPPTGTHLQPSNWPGVLFWQPMMFDQVPPQATPLPFQGPNPANPLDPRVGRVVEPHQPRGSRLQMVYHEDTFDLGYKQSSNYALDVEQMHWSPFADDQVLFDVFDRYSLSLGHSDKRPDLRFFFMAGAMGAPDDCALSTASLLSGLSTDFADNILRGSDLVPVVEDAVYTINPNDAFRAPTGVKYVPYPEFQRSYTWRDERLVTWDPANDVAIGLGGARDPEAPQNADSTAFVDSPWVEDSPPSPELYPPGTLFVMDEADFRGTRARDHNPIALPLLMDFKVFPDDAANSLAAGGNAFQIAMIGQPSNFLLGFPGGYYNQTLPWPLLRVHTSGGKNPVTQQNIEVNPAVVTTATGGWIFDAGLGDPTQGLFQAPAGDSHLHWAQADFVRRVSVVTFGFFDTLKPNQHDIPAGALNVNWSGIGNNAGFPDLQSVATTAGVNLRVGEVSAIMDPPISRQPVGTKVLLELRGAEDFDNATIYDRANEDAYNQRGNLLNPNYACEAYRYAMVTPGLGAPRLFPNVPPGSGYDPAVARVKATGLTPYAVLEDIDDIRDLDGLLPRYINPRIIMENNIDVDPAVAPALEGMAIVFRMQETN